MGLKIDDEDHYMLLLWYFPNTWDNLVMAIGRTTTTFKMEDVVSLLVSEETWRKYSKMAKEVIFVWGRSKERGKKKDKKYKSKSEGRSDSLRKKSKVKC
jgi:hypothetical protein